MNYGQSKGILQEIGKAKKILINCHRGPDPDSVGSALALSKILELMGKEIQIICPSDIPEGLKFLEGQELIKKIDFSSFDFSKYDLFLTIDSASYSMVSGSKNLELPDIKTIVIDHHISNEGFGQINLIDENITSTGELLFRLFEDWGVEITKEVAEFLLTGIVGDTGSFQYQNVGKDTLNVAARLIGFGADKDRIIYNLFRSVTFSEVKMWGKIIESMQIDETHNFVWSKIPITVYTDSPDMESVKEEAANLFSPIIKGTDFGVIMEEREDGSLSVSFRSRSGFDVSKIAKEIGGGGHRAAAGAKIEGLTFEEAVEKVLAASRKYARKHVKTS